MQPYLLRAMLRGRCVLLGLAINHRILDRQQTATAVDSLVLAPITLTILTNALPDTIVGLPSPGNIDISVN